MHMHMQTDRELLPFQQHVLPPNLTHTHTHTHARARPTTRTRAQMLHIGRNVLSDPTKIIQSARFVQEEVRRRRRCWRRVRARACVCWGRGGGARVSGGNAAPPCMLCRVLEAQPVPAAAPRPVRTQLPKRLARRLLDLQLLP
jgi:hypothetical protein